MVNFVKPKVFIYLSVFFVFVFFLSSLFDLQILDGEDNLKKAVGNTYVRKLQQANRGDIFDRNGELISSNVRKYKMFFDVRKMGAIDFEEFRESFIANIESLGLDEKTAIDYLDKLESGNISNSLFQLSSNLSEKDFGYLSKEFAGFISITFVEESHRSFPGVAYSHLVGYTGKPTQQDLDYGLGFTSTVGKTGIESYYDSFLQGQDGEILILKRPDGTREDFVFTEMVPGNSLYLTIDKEWQEKLYSLLEKNAQSNGSLASAAIIIESDTGRVLALTNYPSYDLGLFAGGISVEDYNKLLNDPAKPLLNRVLMMKIAPGSTFKTVVGVSALVNNVITPDFEYYSNGCEKLGGNNFCEADNKRLGTIDFYKATARSSNLYFCNLGRKFNKDFGDLVGIQYLIETAEAFGFDSLSGIDIPGEVPSIMSNPGLISKNRKRNWSLGDMCNTVIGQGEVLATPVQMVRVASAIANGGKLVQPYILSNVLDEKGDILYENKIDIDGTVGNFEVMEIVSDAMREVVIDDFGSSNKLVNLNALGVDLRIKTGSADASERLSNGQIVKGAHSWNIGSFSYMGKDYSFAIVQQFGGRGYYTLPITGNMISCVYSDFEDGCEIY